MGAANILTDEKEGTGMDAWVASNNLLVVAGGFDYRVGGWRD